MEEKELREKNDKNERVKKKGERRQQGRRERKTSGESLRLVVEEGEGEREAGRRTGNFLSCKFLTSYFPTASKSSSLSSWMFSERAFV